MCVVILDSQCAAGVLTSFCFPFLSIFQGTFVTGAAMEGKVKVTFTGTQVRARHHHAHMVYVKRSGPSPDK